MFAVQSQLAFHLLWASYHPSTDTTVLILAAGNGSFLPELCLLLLVGWF